jgi:hypothetical protein
VVDSHNIEKRWEALKTIVLAAENQYTWVHWSPLPKTLPFLPKEVIRANRKKKRAWTKYIRCRRDNHYDMFKKCRNRLRNLTWKIVENHNEAIAADAKQNPNVFWCHVLAANPSRHNIPDLMKEDDTKTSEAKEKADLLNSSFDTNFSTQPIANPPPTLPEQPIEEPMMYMTIVSV